MMRNLYFSAFFSSGFPSSKLSVSLCSSTLVLPSTILSFTFVLSSCSSISVSSTSGAELGVSTTA